MKFSDTFGAAGRWLVRGLVRLYYPRIEVTGADRIPRTGPVLLAANHPNSLIDAVLLGIASRRPIRLLVKAPLFSVPVFGAMLRALGMMPAYRGSDDAKQVTKNLETLAAGARALAHGHVVGIFPEGKSHDATQLALVRSGAARLALQAVALGAKGPQVVPVGLNYERKERFRTAVWINVGEPVDAAAWLAEQGGDEHLAMRTLTAALNQRLKACVAHLDDAAWESLVSDLEFLLPAAGYRRRNALAAVHQRKAAADAINFFHRVDRARAETAARRVREHGAALVASGLPGDARLFQLRGLRLGWALAREGLALGLGAAVGFFGLLHHALPYGLTRVIAGRVQGAGRMTLALTRLLIGAPIYALWYGLVWWWQSRYFMPWIAWTWAALMPFAGLVALDTSRRLRTAGPFWWAQVRLAFDAKRSAALRAEHRAVVQMLSALATEFYTAQPAAATAVERPKSVTYRPPVWLNLMLAGGTAALALIAGMWLLRDRPLEILRQRAPALHALPAGELEEQLAGDERALLPVIAGLDELERHARTFSATLEAGQRSYYRQADDDDIRRMLVSFLSYRAALLRTVWKYQRHAQIGDEAARLRALLLHYTAAAVAYDYSARFVLMFEGREHAMRKLNEAEPRWDLPAGTYDRIRSNLANVSHRRWLETGWQNYHATLPRWTERGMREGEPWATFHAAIARAGENTAGLSERLLQFRVATALADVRGLARGGFYRASSAVSAIVGDMRVREPRAGAALITPARLAELRPKLKPGDILIERRNWYLSNAFLPGYWPHSALYVGTVDDLRAMGLADDPRVARHLARFAQADAAGHVHAVIEAVSEGVIFTSVEHSIGEADSVAVLRPRLSPEQMRELIARAFSHAGKPYDFDFDFFSGDKLVCTEVVYRACSGYVDFPLVEILGRQTLPALEILRYWNTPAGAEKLEFVAFLDGDEKTSECRNADAAELVASLQRPALSWLQ